MQIVLFVLMVKVYFLNLHECSGQSLFSKRSKPLFLGKIRKQKDVIMSPAEIFTKYAKRYIYF